MDQVLKRKLPGTGDYLSILGFGCMRFKRNLASTDMEKAEKQIRLAIESGVNYFDTAYMYPGNEKALGTILAKTDSEGNKLRDRVFVATKLPAMMVKTTDNIDKFFQTSLERLGMDYIDYYLVHSLSNFAAWERIKKLGVVEYLEKAKADGKIGHIGFSWHGNLHDFRKVIDDYNWEFCQIQYNYLDENFQAGTEGMKYAASKGIGIIVMEPLRGGTLAGKLPAEAMKLLKTHKDQYQEKHTPAYWGFRWVWNHPEVTCVLSGMNDISQITENISTSLFSLPDSLTENDIDMINQVKDIIKQSIRVNCTGCAYCMPCPYGVDIPFCLAALNENAIFGKFTSKVMYNFNLRPLKDKPSGKASACKKCGVCETKCPQHLPIVKSLEEAAKSLENPVISGLVSIASKFIGN